jgi:hypothetical protein
MHGKSSVRVVEQCPDIPVAAVQYIFTHKQYTEQHNETEYTERKIRNNKITHKMIKNITKRVLKNVINEKTIYAANFM